MAYLKNDILELSQEELEAFRAAIIKTEEIDGGESLGDVYDEWLTKFARQAFDAAGREFSWEFKLAKGVEEAVFKTIEENFGLIKRPS